MIFRAAGKKLTPEAGTREGEQGRCSLVGLQLEV